MYRFILLYVGIDGLRGFAEGLIHIDNTVYCRGFFPEEGKLYSNLLELKRQMRDNERIHSWHLQMLDEEEVRGVSGI